MGFSSATFLPMFSAVTTPTVSFNFNIGWVLKKFIFMGKRHFKQTLQQPNYLPHSEFLALLPHNYLLRPNAPLFL